MGRNAGTAVLIVGGVVGSTALGWALFGSWPEALTVAVLLLMGPAWALATCLVSEESDYVGASHSRDEWLRTLPWTFLLAPLMLPNLVVLLAFVRDSRSDGGHTVMGSGRDRPVLERYQDHHWP